MEEAQCTFTGYVTTFYSPSLFWFVRESDLLEREKLIDKLNVLSKLIQPLKNAGEGQKVVVHYSNAWLRAEVVDVKDFKQSTKEYICWLLDHGIFVNVAKVYKLPEDMNLIPNFAQKGMLYGLLSVVMEYDFGKGNLQNRQTEQWMPGIRRVVTDLLESTKSIQLFKEIFKFNDNTVCNLLIKHSEGIFDISDKIVGTGLAMFDKNLFFSNMSSMKKEQTLIDIYLELGTKQHNSFEIFRNMNVSVGRGAFRKRNLYSERKYSEQRQISDNFCDSVHDTSGNPENQIATSREEKRESDDLLRSKASVNIKSESTCFGRGVKINKRRNIDNLYFEQSHHEKSLNDFNTSLASFGRGQKIIQRKEEKKQCDMDNDFYKFEDAEDETSFNSTKIVTYGREFERVENQILLNSDENLSDKSNDFIDREEPDKLKDANTRKEIKFNNILNVHPAGCIIKRTKMTRTKNNDSKSEVSTSLKKYNSNENCNVYNKVPKLITGKCLCPVCDSWRDNSKVFENFQIQKPKPSLTPISKPAMLFKTSDDKDMRFQMITKRIFESDTEKSAAPRLLVHGYLLPDPVLDLCDVSFDPLVHKSLLYLKYTSAFGIQTYGWPAVLRGHNVVIVSGPNCGKSMVYIPALCTFLLEKNPNINDSNGLIAIVLCPRVKIVNNIYFQFKNILGSSRQVCAVTHLYDKTEKASFYKSKSILITTPRMLLRMLQLELISLKMLCHVVLDETKDLFSLFHVEMDVLCNKFQKILKYRTFNTSIQMIIISQEWSLSVENLAKKLKYPPTICIGAHLEAALYGRADIQIQMVDSKNKTNKIIEIIKNQYKISKTIIIYNDGDDISEILEDLEVHGISLELLAFNAPVENVNTIKKSWNNSIVGRHFLLVCSDNIFNTLLAITDAQVIIQLTLPENWSQFSFRFSGFLDNYSYPLMENNKTLNCKMHIFVDETNQQQFPKIIKFLLRMGCKLNQNILDLYNKLTNEIENKKLKDEIQLCENLLCFGSCELIPNCKKRHILSSTFDISNKIPQSGLIKFRLLHIKNPMQYYVRLIEHTDSNSNVHEVDNSFTYIVTQMISYRNKELIPLIQIRIGDLCATEDKNGIFKRCQVIDIFNTKSFNVKKVVIQYIDYGDSEVIDSSKLYILPENLQNISPQAVPVYISNIGPLDQDICWPEHCTNLLRKKFQSFDCTQENTYYIGRIKLQLGGILFVDNIKLKEVLENGTIIIPKINICKYLTDMKMLEDRSEHLKNLYALCNNFNINLPDYNLPVIKKKSCNIKQAKPNWAHLENLEEFNMVYFCNAYNPHLFFVKLCKNTSCLEQIAKDIEEAMNKPFYPNNVEAIEGNCYLVKDPVERNYQRAIVKTLKENTAICLFVDYGDEIEIPIEELKYLPDNLITQLPFQIIECKLYGIEPINEVWSNEATDLLYNVAYEPHTDFLRFLQVKVKDSEKAQITNYKKYSVILIDTFEQDTIINNLMLDKNYAIQNIDKDLIKIDFNKLQLKNQYTESNYVSDEDDSKTVEVDENIDLNSENCYADNEDDDEKWDFQLNNPEEFMRDLFKIPKQVSEKPAIIYENKNENSENLSISKLPALPSPGYSTPKVIWQQTNTHIMLRIQIPAVEEYEVKVMRKRLFTFKTMYKEIEYRLDLNLYSNVHSTIEHDNIGLYISVKLQKQTEEEWPRLIINTEKFRNISYNVAVIPEDDGCDDEKPLTKKEFDKSKECAKLNDDENGPFKYEYGSDIDWEESDIESENDSDD